MKNPKVYILGFYKQHTSEISDLSTLLKQKGYDFTLLEEEATKERVMNELQHIKTDLFLCLSDLNNFHWSPHSFDTLPDLKPKTIYSAASALFDFQNDELQYFYWKHYPRPHTWYNFPDTSVLYGRVDDFKELLADLGRYGNTFSIQHLITRFYADVSNKCFYPSVRIRLDHDQILAASTIFSKRRSLKTSWLFAYLFMRNQRSMGHGYLLNVSKPQNKFHHAITGKNPAFVSTSIKSISKSVSKFPFIKALKDWIYIGRINRWHFTSDHTFRNRLNVSQALNQGTKAIVDRLERKQPLSFAHYNDGELTFISNFQQGVAHEKWFGRKQQKYDPLLGERLLDAMKFQKEGYFVGVPCSIDHQELRKQANEIVGEYDFKVQAMSIHHNLAYMPRILSALTTRDVYFFINEYQDLSFFEHLGISVNKEKVTVVPFKNSYLEYDKYRGVKFPEDAVVVMTCGMLAKILTHVWYQKHDRLTVLALGSSLDDHIQKQNINFELYPKDTPLTRNLKFSRSFLFGYKKPCKECYDL